MGKLHHAASAFALALTTWNAPVFAQGGAVSDGLTLRVHNCAHLSEERLDRLLRMELKTLGWDEHPEPIQLRVDCFAEAMTLQATTEGVPTLDRHLGGAPSGVDERETALSASELVAELWESEPAVLTVFAEQPEEPPKKAPTRRAAITVTGDFAGLTQPGRIAGGGALAYSHRILPAAELALEVGASWGRAKTDEVEVQQQMVHVAPELRWVQPAGRATWTVGLSVPLGWVWFDPESRIEGAEPVSLSGPWSALLAKVRHQAPLGKRTFLAFGVEAGGVTLPVRGEVNGATAVALSGLLYGADVGLGVSF